MKRNKPHICHVSQRLLGKDTLATNSFGIILTADKLNDVDINHELIHTAQMKEMLYIFFYIWYGIEWLVLFIKYHDWKRPTSTYVLRKRLTGTNVNWTISNTGSGSTILERN